MTMDERIRARDERIDLMFGEADLRGRERARVEALEARAQRFEEFMAGRVQDLEARCESLERRLCHFCHQPHTGAECVDDGPPESYAEPVRCGFCKVERRPGADCVTTWCCDYPDNLAAELDGDHD